MPRMPIVTLTPDEATQALEAVFALHGAATIELDYDHAVLVGLELRLTDHDREVPRDAWPDIARWIHDVPA